MSNPPSYPSPSGPSGPQRPHQGPTGPYHRPPRPQPGPPYYGYPAAPQPGGMSTGKKWAIGLGAGCAAPLLLLVLLGACGALLYSSTEDSATDIAEEAEVGADDVEPVPDEDETYNVGEEVEHGDWTFTVHGIEYEVPTDELGARLPDDPTGEWAVLTMDATNTSDEPAYFEANDQVLMDEGGSMFRREVTASSGYRALDQVNPGTSLEIELAYDVSEGFEADHAIVNGDGRYADGALVNLG